MTRLVSGIELDYIEDTPDVDGECSIWKVGQPHSNCSGKVIRITVEMQNGQMADVPWGRVEFENEPDMLINLANIKLVQLKDWRY